MKKRWLTLAVAATAAITVLAGCGSKTAETTAAATEAAPAFTKPAQPAFNRTFNPGAAAQPTYTVPKFTGAGSFNTGAANTQEAPKQAAPSTERTAPSFRPAANKEMQINIPDFLKNKR